MSLFLGHDKRIISVAMANCPRCFGTGILTGSYSTGGSINVSIGFCDCVKAVISSPAAPSTKESE